VQGRMGRTAALRRGSQDELPRSLNLWNFAFLGFSEVQLSEWGCYRAASPMSYPFPNASVVGINHPVVPMQILPGREILGRRLEHPRPIALLHQHPRRSNGHIIYYAGGHELALEMRFPDPRARRGSPSRLCVYRTRAVAPRIVLHQGRKLSCQRRKVAGRVPGQL
jgi:hypothetical protein